MRTAFALLALLLAAPAAAQPYRVAEGERMQVVARQSGWTVLRDRQAPRGAAETGMVLIRVQRPVAPGFRDGHLGALLRSFRPFHFGALPAEAAVRLAGLPGHEIVAPARGAPSGVALTVRAVCLYGPDRSYLIIAAAPAAEWDGLAPEFARILDGFRPG